MDVLNEFIAAIDIERQKSIEEYEETMNQPLDERMANGTTMSNLTVSFDFYSGPPNNYCAPLHGTYRYIQSAEIFCENNNSKFKEGAYVVLSNEHFRFEMIIEEDSTDNFILKPNEFNLTNCVINADNYPRNNWEINAMPTDVSTKMLLAAAVVVEGNTDIQQKIAVF
jgi:hypothetical protein